MSGITRDEWLKAIADVETTIPEGGNALSMIEFQTLLGIGRSSAKRRIGALLREGKAEQVKKLIRRSDGAVVAVTAYRLVQE